jgi:hypothetical protein
MKCCKSKRVALCVFSLDLVKFDTSQRKTQKSAGNASTEPTHCNTRCSYLAVLILIQEMNFARYSVATLALSAAAVAQAYSARGQFYSSAVYLSTSRTHQMVLFNLGVLFLFVLCKALKTFFLGTLRDFEVEVNLAMRALVRSR